MEYKKELYYARRLFRQSAACNEAKYWIGDTFHLELQKVSLREAAMNLTLGHPVHLCHLKLIVEKY